MVAHIVLTGNALKTSVILCRLGAVLITELYKSYFKVQELPGVNNKLGHIIK
jgi:hypothetical protein